MAGSYITLARGIAPNADDLVVAEISAGQLVFREFYHRAGKVVLGTPNARWPEYEFSADEWAGVNVLGVVLSFETIRRRLG